MFPIVTFPSMSISNYSEDMVLKEEKEGHVCFKARENFRYGDGIQPIRIFNAWGDMASLIKKMLFKKGTEVTIVAQLRSYRDKEGRLRDSYTVIAIDYLRTYQKKEENLVQIEQDESSEHQIERRHIAPGVTMEADMIDMDTFEKIMGKNI